MARGNRQPKHTILVVCEGESTEPSYFEDMLKAAAEFYPEGLSYAIDPKPRALPDTDSSSSVNHKSARKKRNIQIPERLFEDAIEAEYIGMPTRFVRAAQLGLEDGTYDKAYAVFDRDGHDGLEAAFSLADTAIEGKKVMVGFSSISFEHWVLLHFEYSEYSFTKSDCKDANDKKRYLGCGKHIHPDDCNGTRCVAGYLRENKLLDYKKSDDNLWSALRPKLNRSLRNARWLTFQQTRQHPTLPIFELNPVVTINAVIEDILQISTVEKCIAIGEKVSINQIEYWIARPSEDVIELHLKNNRTTAFVIKPEDFWIENVLGDHLPSNFARTLIQPEDSFQFRYTVTASYRKHSIYDCLGVPDGALLISARGSSLEKGPTKPI